MIKKNIGIDIGGTKMYMLAEHDGKYIEKKVPTGKEIKPEMLKKYIIDFIKDLPFEVEGIGMAIPGLVEDENKVNFSNVVPGLNGLKSEYFSYKGAKVKFINDVKAALVEEASYYPEDYTVSVFMAGTGIAVATKTNKEIVYGANSWAGEIGFAPIAVKDKVYKLDELSSGASILKKFDGNVEELIKKLENEDKEAEKIIREAGYYFGIGLAITINLFNPNIIVVGGSTSTYKNYFETALEVASENALKQAFESCEIKRPKDMKRIVALGARKYLEKD
ncbi:ROK family protein [Oceanotoga sp. DSM 15011]|jgi:predicted NBD/HSP70 family sugar kinase|uniref:ROK family protein n=1 Tax=Oceanotoga sp. DSM 15011 TaxID=2984951 RepID=UPI0021F4E071|nr:ROK family protein [Oceanotoga sp. DSM 15011]UYO99484.1 ROK family protein [Oceanotoga sp. DSM 15011]